jgi:hypothetical protein
MEMIRREKYMSNFHLYLTNSDAEIDCINIRESCLTGAIPILSNHGIFKERDGIHIEIDETNQASYINAALKVLELMKDPGLEVYRNNLKNSKTLISWSDVAAKWLEQI